MIYGNLVLFSGPMFSGKSTSLLKEFLWQNHRGKNTVLLKPTFDDRFSATEMVTHNGMRALAHNIARSDDIRKYDTCDSIFIDECQFLVEPHFHGDAVSAIRDLLSMGVDFYVSGLDMDYKGNPFEVSAYLLAMADEVHKMKSVCALSGSPASKTWKKGGSNSSIELGSSDKYEPRSNQYWEPK